MKYIALILLTLITCLRLGGVQCEEIYESAEKKLLDDLLFPEHKMNSPITIFDLNELNQSETIKPNMRFIYNKFARPIEHPHKPIEVTLALTALRLVRVIEKDQILHVDIMLTKTWHDYQLRWDPTKYDGIESIYVPIDRIWTPDVDLINKADATDIYMDGRMARVTHEGLVTWSPHYFFKVYCTLDMTKFPYDTQNCPLLFGSWTYDASKLRLRLPAEHGTFVLNDKVTKKEWHVTTLPPWTHVLQFPCCSETYDLLIFRLRMSRDSLYHRYVLFMPGVLLCFLTIFVLLLPPQSREKISLGIGIIIGLILMILVLDDFLPTDMASIPLIVKYYAFALVLTITYIAISSWVLNMYHQEPKGGQIPHWLRKVISCRCFRLCMSRDLHSRLTEDLNTERFVFRVDENVRQMEDMCPITENAAPMAVSSACDGTTERLLEEIRGDLKSCVSVLKNSQKHSQWFYLAVLINRMASCIYIVGTVAITAVILLP